MNISGLKNKSGNTTCFQKPPCDTMSVIKPLPNQEVASPPSDSPSLVRRVMRNDDTSTVVREESPWVYYSKPVTLVVIGGLVFFSGVVLAALHFTKHEVPYALGPVCLSAGLMFVVMGAVWIPIIRRTVRCKGLLRRQARKAAAASGSCA
ncbi:phosphoinositide-interacting protein [Alligator sinensis]|uniref:Phosphoinositide-interacting protein n=1 Tax=Alligator sinensis TaxID=38654 RepID=A0A3Q0GVM6_ALLSI|nr:phosphoinositide-interacting protein [Alligator sinensis]